MISTADLGFTDKEMEYTPEEIAARQLAAVPPISESEEDLPEYVSATDNVSADAHQIQNAARSDLNFLAGLAMPDIFKYYFPIIFTGIWQWLTELSTKTRDFSQIALGLPRGFSKTTILKLFILYCILFTKKSFILYIAGTQTKANDVIGDITDMLDEPNIKAVFGDWRVGLIIDRADFKLFGFRGRNVILRGAGAGSDIRGITRKNRRPDIMIFDDVQTREDADSEVISDQIENWMQGTAMKAKSPEGCLFIFLANMYPTKFSILKRLKRNPNWLKFITGGITEDGKSLWEELHPITQLIREYQNDAAAGKAQIFFSEVLNDENATLNNNFDLSKVPEWELDPNEIHQGNAVIIDPSNDKVNSDAVTHLYYEVHQGKPYAKIIRENEGMSPLGIIELGIKLCLENNCRVLAIESVAFQYSLLFWFNYVCNQYGITGIEAVEIYPGSQSKNARILQWFNKYASGENQIAPSERPIAHAQISQFNPMKANNRDGILDCLQYMDKCTEMYGHMMSAYTVIEDQEHRAIKVVSETEGSPF